MSGVNPRVRFQDRDPSDRGTCPSDRSASVTGGSSSRPLMTVGRIRAWIRAHSAGCLDMNNVSSPLDIPVERKVYFVLTCKRGFVTTARPIRREEGPVAAVDPVCGMTIEESDAVGTSEYEGTTYYFCSKDCKEEFDSAPEDYA